MKTSFDCRFHCGLNLCMAGTREVVSKTILDSRSLFDCKLLIKLSEPEPLRIDVISLMTAWRVIECDLNE